MMSIREWPEHQRPREKLLSLGPQALSDAELLAIFIHTGIRGRSALDIAHEVLMHFGGLRALLKAAREDFCAQPGLSLTKLAQLQAALEISQRHMWAQLKQEGALNSTQVAREYIWQEMHRYEREVFACLFLDIQGRLLNFETLFFGTIDSSSVHPREILKRALYHNASAVILAHNHPTGTSLPSPADRQLTHVLQHALSLIDVRIRDHIVVGESETSSFVDLGWL